MNHNQIPFKRRCYFNIKVKKRKDSRDRLNPSIKSKIEFNNKKILLVRRGKKINIKQILNRLIKIIFDTTFIRKCLKYLETRTKKLSIRT